MNQEANERDRGDGGIRSRLHTGRAWPAAPHHERLTLDVGIPIRAIREIRG